MITELNMAEIFTSTLIIKNRIAALTEEHRDLDEAITVLGASCSVNELQIRRLKKRKLLLRDQITQLQKTQIADILA
jgi:hypothetical protein